MPKHWGELNTVTIAFGHGIAVAPLQAVMAVGALMNGGKLIPPTFLKRSEAEAAEFAQAGGQARDQRPHALPDAAQCREGLGQDASTSRVIMSAAKPAPRRRWSTGIIPRPSCSRPSWRCFPPTSRAISSPSCSTSRQATPETKGFATSGWNAAPTAGLVVERIAPMLGVAPRFDLPPSDRQILAVTSGIR